MKSLLEETRRLLDEALTKTTMRAIADKAELSRTWVHEFHRRKTPDPGIIKVQKLYNTLTSGEFNNEV